MDQSQYLIAALNGLQNPAQVASQPQVDVQGLAALGKKAQAYQQANPGGNFMGHQLMQAGRNVMGAPGDVMSGLAKFAQGLPGVQQPLVPPY